MSGTHRADPTEPTPAPVPADEEQPLYDLLCAEFGFTPAEKADEIRRDTAEYDRLMREALGLPTPDEEDVTTLHLLKPPPARRPPKRRTPKQAKPDDQPPA